jgi:DedD protein
MAESEDIEILKRRGRRRLLGAIALVLLAVIVLPMVFDQEQKVTSVPVSVRIPGEDATPFAPKAASPSAPQPAPSTTKPNSAPPSAPAAQGPEPKTGNAEEASRASPAPQEKAGAAVAPAAPHAVEAKPAARQELIIPVVALANRDKLKTVTDKLKKAKLPYYTERVSTAKGTVTRVRVGPYDRREAAERAHKKLKELGFTPGAITTRSG